MLIFSQRKLMMESKLIVIAIGGNSLIEDPKNVTVKTKLLTRQQSILQSLCRQEIGLS